MKKNTVVAEAMAKLKSLQKNQRDLRKEIDSLRQSVRDAGGDPDTPEVDLTARNKIIFKAWKDGIYPKDIALEHKLSAERVRGICRRIEVILENRKKHFEKYKDLLRYK